MYQLHEEKDDIERNLIEKHALLDQPINIEHPEHVRLMFRISVFFLLLFYFFVSRLTVTNP